MVAESVLGEPGTQGLSVMAEREPLVGAVVMAKVSSQVSRSEPVRVMTTGVFSLVEAEIGSAVGESLTEMETVAGEEEAVPSFVV